MRKFIFLFLTVSALLAIKPETASAQLTMVASKTYATVTDTVTYSLLNRTTASRFSSFQIDVSKDSGTVVGKVYLEVSNGTNFVRYMTDSLLVGNTTAVQSKIFTLPGSATIAPGDNYLSYRLKLVTSGGRCTAAGLAVLKP